ncbi:MAG: TSUP family transporter [Solirubrobacterales bacterium]
MDLALAILVCALGGVVAGLIGVGGGVLFVPALVAFLSLDQVAAEATSLLMISIVSLFGALSQRRFGNVGLLIGLLSPVGVVVGVVLANNIPERALKIAFGLLALYVAWKLVAGAFDREARPTESG